MSCTGGGYGAIRVAADLLEDPAITRVLTVMAAPAAWARLATLGQTNVLYALAAITLLIAHLPAIDFNFKRFNGLFSLGSLASPDSP
ncbi:hypothetical protein GCM10014719_65700 [Planomonospora parontospora subsp. antibiotica]|nr:hypothetical protein GCM10014719_65700 [Planomonospora parontospora subsp. antibiotica]GII19796.1 hypothetical protein Ppa05_65220 [Planomonospora parontospora subsp. antibiotica]